MPVSLFEWRVRIGTFVHWIRDYEVREKKERLLKERIRRLKVLCERLKAKRDDTEQGSQDDGDNADEINQDGSTPKRGCACSHKTANRQSLCNSSDIEDLLTSCDQCIQDLLKPTDSHIKEILTPSDTCDKQILTSNDSCLKDLLSKTNSCRKDQDTTCESLVEDLTPDYSNISEFLIHSDSCIRELLTSADSWKDNLLLSLESCRNDQPTQSDSTNNDLLSRVDSDIKVLLESSDTYAELQTPSDSYVHDLLSPRDSYIHGLLTPTESFTNELFTPRQSYVNELPSSDGSSVRDQFRITELMATESYIEAHHRASDSFIKELVTSDDACIEQTTSPKFCIEMSNTLSKTALKEQALPESSAIVHISPTDSSNKAMINVGEQRTSSDSCSKDDRTGVGSESPTIGTKHENSACHQSRFSSTTSTSDSNVAQNGLPNPKEISNPSSRSSSPRSLNASLDAVLQHNPCLTELLLVRAGDVELNPGPLHGTIHNVLQDSELVLLAQEVPGHCYTKLCIALGFSYTESKNILTEQHLNIQGAMIEFFCKWKIKQRDGTDCRAVLAEILGKADMGALQSRLLAGGSLMTESSPSVSDTPQPLKDMTEEQVFECGENLKTFYRENMCKIKTDPLDFNYILEFERIYTNLKLLRSNKPLDDTALFTTKVNGVLPKRLMVEGEGGVGKTTLCSKIAWDWANGSPEFQEFSWVLVIPLRKVIKGQTVGDIMKNCLSDNNTVTPKQINDYILSQPKKVLIILDGLDEYDGDLSDSSDISQILTLKKFKLCRVLVTTRPWRADQIKSNEGLSRSYAFIAVKGFSKENVSTYINKYFMDDKMAGSELIRFIEVNDVIRDNMAPFPIYVAMLCILWKNSDTEKRETMRRLKTFSQLFDKMITFLRDHYISKVAEVLQEAFLDETMKNIQPFLLEIGSLAFSGLLKRKMVFTERDFISCKKAMETCCRIGVLSREKQNISRWQRTLNAIQSVSTNVYFPHKLFQEYIAALHIASLYDTDRDEYSKSLDKVMGNDPRNMLEFRYLLYFTAAQGKDVGLDIVNKIQKKREQNISDQEACPFENKEEQIRKCTDFLVDVTFEAYSKETAKSVGRMIFSSKKILTIDKAMSAHTTSGYLFIMEQQGMETLIFRDRSCGPTVSRDLADLLSTSSSLSKLEFHRTRLDEDFYRLMLAQVSTLAEDRSINSVKELYVDHYFLSDLQRFNTTIRDLFPSLKQLYITVLQTVSPEIIKRLAHSGLSVLSIRQCEDVNCPVPLIGDPDSLGQLFSSSFPLLTSLKFEKLVIGNIRVEAILHVLRNHLHLKSISIVNCFTDDELDPLAQQITAENRMEITLQHDTEQHTFIFPQLTTDVVDALCHRTCVGEFKLHNGVKITISEEWFPELHGREVDSKIHSCVVRGLELCDDQSASRCLGKFICLLPCLTDLKILLCSFHDEFYKEIADRASSSKIHTCVVEGLHLRDDQSASRCLGKFLCLLPCLTDLKIWSCSFHDEFYKEIADRASSSKYRQMLYG